MAKAFQLFALILATSAPAAAQRTQQPAIEYVGVVRNDGIALPLFEWTGNDWIPAESPFPQGRRGMLDVRTFFYSDSAGVAHRLAVGALVDLWDTYDDWGYLTNFARQEPTTRRATYMASDSVAHAPFVRQETGLDSAYLLPLIDSLAPLPDSVPSTLSSDRSWQARLGNDVWTFFTATRRGGGYPEPCYIVHGLRRGDGTSEQLLQHGGDDCEGKGMGSRSPYALVRKGASLHVLIEASGWESLSPEIWTLGQSGTWTVLEGPNRGL
jgi:hypothetical protein